MHLLSSIKYHIYMQQLSLTAPYRVINNRAVSSGLMTIFILSYLVSGSALLVVAFKSMGDDESYKMQFKVGYLWGIIGTFELTISNISYPLLVLYTFFHRKREIDFLNSFQTIDTALENQFDVNVSSFNSNIRRRSMVFLCISSMYFYTLWSLGFFFVIPKHFRSYFGYMVILISNQLQQFSMSILTWTIVQYAVIIRSRFQMLRSVQLTEILGHRDDVRKIRKLMATWLNTFRDTCRTIERLNDNMGLVIMWRYAHDFTLLISQLYLIYYIVEQERPFMVLISVCFWSMQNVYKLFAIGYSAEKTIRELYSCAATVNALNKDDVDPVVKQMLDSFGLWLLHRKIRFTANNFFTVDLTLVYAVVGALASYLLILIQFKQQEEALTAMNANVTNVN